MKYLYREVYPDKSPCIVIDAQSVWNAAIQVASRPFAKVGDVFDVGEESAFEGESPWYRFRITKAATVECVPSTSTPEPQSMTLYTVHNLTTGRKQGPAYYPSTDEAAKAEASRTPTKVGDAIAVEAMADYGPLVWTRYRVVSAATETEPARVIRMDAPATPSSTPTPEQSPKRITLEFSGVRITIETQEAE